MQCQFGLDFACTEMKLCNFTQISASGQIATYVNLTHMQVTVFSSNVEPHHYLWISAIPWFTHWRVWHFIKIFTNMNPAFSKFRTQSMILIFRICQSIRDFRFTTIRGWFKSTVKNNSYQNDFLMRYLTQQEVASSTTSSNVFTAPWSVILFEHIFIVWSVVAI